MHELSIVEALIDQVRGEVDRSGHAGRITRVDVAIGRLSGVNADCFRFAFEMLAPGTPLEAAQLVLREPKAICRCRACGHSAEIDELPVLCPRCQGSDLAVEGGQDLLLETIELATEAPATAANRPNAEPD